MTGRVEHEDHQRKRFRPLATPYLVPRGIHPQEREELTGKVGDGLWRVVWLSGSVGDSAGTTKRES